MALTFSVNGKPATADVPSDMPLLWVLRDVLDLKGTKFGSYFDLILCRNVMIYFDRPTQERLVGKFFKYLKPGGHLFIGHSESLQWVTHSFKTIAPTIYWKER